MTDVRRRRFTATILTFVAVFVVLLLALLFAYAKIKVVDVERRDRAREREGKIVAVVAVEPCADLVQRVVGERGVALAMTPRGKSPEEYAPTPSQLADLADADLFFRVGMPIEERFVEQLDKLAQNATIVDLTRDVEPIAEGDDDESVDPHVWTSPEIARKMTREIADAFVELDPDGADVYRANADALDAELAELQTRVAEKLAPFQGRAFIVCHPAYGYFAREFHLTQRAIEREGKAPRARDLEELANFARQEDGARAIIVQPEFNRAAAQAFADRCGIELIEHSPLEKDYFENATKLTDAIARSIKE